MTFLGGSAWMVLGVMDRLGALFPSLSLFNDLRIAWMDDAPRTCQLCDSQEEDDRDW